MGADLAALVASPHFRWKHMAGARFFENATPGMGIYRDGVGRVPDGAMDGHMPSGARPDLTDPATIGCLEALAAEAWDDPCLYLSVHVLNDGRPHWCVFTVGYGGGPVTHAPSKGEALALAILRAHPPEVSDV